jgi:hypothetical protein
VTCVPSRFSDQVRHTLIKRPISSAKIIFCSSAKIIFCENYGLKNMNQQAGFDAPTVLTMALTTNFLLSRRTITTLKLRAVETLPAASIVNGAVQKHDAALVTVSARLNG